MEPWSDATGAVDDKTLIMTRDRSDSEVSTSVKQSDDSWVQTYSNASRLAMANTPNFCSVVYSGYSVWIDVEEKLGETVSYIANKYGFHRIPAHITIIYGLDIEEKAAVRSFEKLRKVLENSSMDPRGLRMWPKQSPSSRAWRSVTPCNLADAFTTDDWEYPNGTDMCYTALNYERSTETDALFDIVMDTYGHGHDEANQFKLDIHSTFAYGRKDCEPLQSNAVIEDILAYDPSILKSPVVVRGLSLWSTAGTTADWQLVREMWPTTSML